MLSVPDMALLGAAALLLFGPDQLPKVMRNVGRFTREVQNTSQAFIREMERAADVDEPKPPAEDFTYYEPPTPAEFAAADEESPVAEKLAEPRAAFDEVDEPRLPFGEAEERLLPLAESAPPSHPAEPAPQTDHSAHV